jgi:hypothetical protein
MSSDAMPRDGSVATAWRMALDAWRTLGAHARDAVVISAVPALVVLIGSALLSKVLIGEAFPTPDDLSNSMGSLLALLDLALYGASMLIVFVSWVRLLLKLEPASWLAVGAHHAKAAPIWFVTWLTVPLLVGLLATIVLVPAVLVVLTTMDNAASPAWEQGAPAGIDLVAIIVTWTAIAFASAPLLLRVALVAAGFSKQAAAWAPVVALWPRVGLAFALAAVPLMILALPLDQDVHGFDWIVTALGVVLVGLATLLEGAVCARTIREVMARQAA